MPQQATLQKSATGKSLCVATNPIAAEAGASILRAGGNAFDAVAAIGFMESVVTPHGTGLGGYGGAGTAFVAKTGEVIGIDANTVAPAAARPEMFPVIPGRDPNDFKFPDSRHKIGPLSVGVPGVVSGLCLMVEKYGRLKLAQVIQPALDQARSGATLTRGNAETWYKMAAEALGKPKPESLPAKNVGIKVAMPGLAKALEQIAAQGPRVFYEGEIGRAIASHIQKLGGILTDRDMAAYQARITPALSMRIGDSETYTAEPAAGGHTCLQMLFLADTFKSVTQGLQWGTPQWWHGWLEIMKTAWEDRLTKLADPKSMKSSPQDLLTDDYLDKLWLIVERRLKQPDLGRIVAPDPLRGTIHCSAADSEGNHVAWTQTHGGGYGSMVMVPEWEVVLGHGMCRFEPRPGWANSVAPFKRPLHNMCPILTMRSGKPIFSVGAQGGRTIVNNVAAIAVGHLVFGRDAGLSLADPRIQCETMEPFQIEKSAGELIIEQIRAKGHLPTPLNKDPGSAQVIAMSKDDLWTAHAEPRLPNATAKSI
ncbi:MAG: gamma-glutamyltransferase [Planctomycetota bacterium]|nr:gamma-glutamyltransferase [Planctomycetota bacterium]